MEQFDKQFVDGVLDSYNRTQTNLIGIMQDIQRKYRYLSQEVMSYIAKGLKISEAKVYSVATFYENFSLEPKGKYVLRVCDGTACHVRKSQDVLNTIYSELKLGDKKTTDDLLFTVETVSCLGACGLAPVLTVNDVVYHAMTSESTKALLARLKEEQDV